MGIRSNSAIAASLVALATGASAGTIPCDGGTAGGFPCEKVDLLAHVSLAELGGTLGADLWGWTDPSGRDFALVALSDGTAFVEITDRENPIFLGTLPTATGASVWRDVETYRGHAYIVSDGNGAHGVQVFELTALLNVVSPPVTFTETTRHTGVNSAHTIAINAATGFAYVHGSNQCNGGLYILDLAIPRSPSFAGCFSADGYTHESQVVVYDGPDATYAGREIAFCGNEDTLTIVDVTNKAAPLMVSRTGYPDKGYTSKGWLSGSRRFFLHADELDEINEGSDTRTHIWDVSDLDNPQYQGFHLAGIGAIDHQVVIRDAYAYQANFEAGLRVLRIREDATATLEEVAYFDTHAAGDDAGFDGAWGVYPFFDDGTVIVSDRQEGLFILRPRLCPADLDGDGLVSVTDLLIILGAWGTPGGDVNVDGVTDTVDLLAFLGGWGVCP